jgi:hypothetical protein|uniref:Uncharacterized protein n=1 Tax=viral metagenome TaxID=1070528 RepID=A0A6C0E1L4_9ZZZZ
MSGIVNLESAIRTCKVDTGYSSRVQSDRFLNPSNLVCPVWNGLDTAGRLVCANSFKTKREGCNSAEDRVGIENIQRPQYMQYISMQTSANSYNNNYQVPEGVKENFENMDFSGDSKIYLAGFGQNLAGQVYPRTCGYNRYDDYSRTVGL